MKQCKNNTKVSKFINTLHNCLQNRNYNNIIQWGEQERGFKIINIAELKRNILRNDFQINTLSTFQRQLNIYGFKVRRNEMNEKEYCHNHFTKDKLYLSKIQRRRPIKYPQEIECIQNIREQNQQLFIELQEMKTNQKQMLHQFQINCQIQLKVQNNIKIFLEQTHRGIHQDGKLDREIFIYFLNIILGLHSEPFDSIVQFMNEQIAILPQTQTITDTPIPFQFFNGEKQKIFEERFSNTEFVKIFNFYNL